MIASKAGWTRKNQRAHYIGVMKKLYLIHKGIFVLNNLVFRAMGVICICFSISACSTSGSLALRTVSPTTIGNILKPGVSTKEHIISVLGSPNNVGLTQSGLEILTYEYKRNIPSFWNFTPFVLFSFQSRVHVKQLVILLNEDKTVKQTATNDTMLHSSFGIDE